MNAIPCIVVGAMASLLLVSPAFAAQSKPGEAIDVSTSQHAGSTLQVAQTDTDAMLRCARMRDVASQLRCFDEVKRGKSTEGARKESRSETPAEPAAVPRKSVGDESRHVARYAQEVARELGKHMYQEDYPSRAREEGRGGTTELLLRVNSDAKLTQVSVSRSSGYNDLDQFALNKVSNLRLPNVPPTIRSPVFSVYLPITFAIRPASR